MSELFMMLQDEELCERHMAPWEGLEPEALIMVLLSFQLDLFNALVGHRPFIEQCDRKFANIKKNMPKPLCCWVEKEIPQRLIKAYEKLGVTEIDIRV